jgi:hypothetical protein
MSETTVGPDVATPHALVVTDTFTGRSQGGYPTPPYPVGFVLAVASLGQTNVHAGQGPRHPKATLIEHPTAKPGDVLSEADLTAGIATAKAKQALVPGQQKAREAQRQAAVAAAAKVIPDLQAKVAELQSLVVAMKATHA